MTPLAKVPALVRCGTLCVTVQWKPVGHLLPTPEELNLKKAAFAGRSWAFLYGISLILIIGTVPALLIQVWSYLSFNLTYTKLPVKTTTSDGEAPRDLARANDVYSLHAPAETDAEKNFDSLEEKEVDDHFEANLAKAASFAAFLSAYQCFCCGIAFLAAHYGLQNSHTGMDYEFYLVWIIAVVLMHWGCLVARCLDRKPAISALTALKIMAKSIIPFVSEPCDMMRDSTVLIVYLGTGVHGLGPAALLVFSCTMPLVQSTRDRTLLMAMRKAFWLIYDHGDDDKQVSKTSDDGPVQKPVSVREASVGSGSGASGIVSRAWKAAWTAFVNMMVEMSSPLKQTLTKWEEAPQAAAGLLYGFLKFHSSHGQAKAPMVVVVTTSISLLKVVVILGGRPFYLSWQADLGIPWSDVSAEDVYRASRQTWVGSWKGTLQQCRDLAVSDGALNIRVAAFSALRHLMAIRKDGGPDERKALTKTLFQPVFRILTDPSHEIRDCAMEILTAAGFEFEQDALQALVDAFTYGKNNGDWRIFLQKFQDLETMGSTCKDLLLLEYDEQILELLKHNEAEVVRDAMLALELLTEHSDAETFISEHGQQLVKLFQDSDQVIGPKAAQLINKCGGKAVCVASHVAQLFKEAKGELEKAHEPLVQNLRCIKGEAAKSISPEIAKLVKEGDAEVSKAATDVLSQWGSCKELVDLLKDENENVRRAAADATRNLEPGQAVLVVSEVLSSLRDEDKAGLLQLSFSPYLVEYLKRENA
eukprot:TRINITY_DN22423_c0_g1_i1.p1 TRINITY_DN22423_c0_g1~~TRINITY_DN22423_c0_g1_i1.p1  ORF type:complete len:784 (+),score=155.55 TRINITY_DN22423_c0_g1_i1:80-2353(+)